MSPDRHSAENRVTLGVTPLRARIFVEVLRRRATRRKLILLECAIIREAPFAECGRPIWDLLPKQSWFKTSLPKAERIREIRGIPRNATGRPPAGSSSVELANGHLAVEWLEQYADGASDDLRVLAEEYFRHAEWAAEGQLFVAPPGRSDELELSYGVANWLYSLISFDERSWNILDHYLANHSSEIACYSWPLPLHANHWPASTDLIYDIFGHPTHDERFDPAWRTSTAVALATQMYDARDFAAMSILADALQDAGCDNEDLLSHCRMDPHHVRGCWAVDGVLRKE
jgi:hypothetical protein